MLSVLSAVLSFTLFVSTSFAQSGQQECVGMGETQARLQSRRCPLLSMSATTPKDTIKPSRGRFGNRSRVAGEMMASIC